MNAMTTRESRRDEMTRLPEGFAEPTREELERTQGGLALASSYTYLLPYLRAQPEPPGITVFRF